MSVATALRPWRLRMPQASEHLEQMALIRWASMMSRRIPQLRLLFAIPNGGARDAVTGRRLKDEGVRRGVPDLFLPVPIPPYAGLFLELKRVGGGTLSPEQRRWLEDLRESGYQAIVCHGWREAVRVIEEYLRL